MTRRDRLTTASDWILSCRQLFGGTSCDLIEQAPSEKGARNQLAENLGEGDKSDRSDSGDKVIHSCDRVTRKTK